MTQYANGWKLIDPCRLPTPPVLVTEVVGELAAKHWPSNVWIAEELLVGYDHIAAVVRPSPLIVRYVQAYHEIPGPPVETGEQQA